MKIVILGGGLTGLTAAYYLSQVEAENEIVVIEKGERLGGLAGGFKKEGWAWELERTYHHIFKNDTAILALSKDINFQSFVFLTPKTASLFGEKNNYRIFPVDSPKDFLLLPVLSFISKIRAGITLVFLKLTPHLPLFEKTTSAEFLQKTMGREVWSVLWERLFQNKYGRYTKSILASFIWARIHKRTQQLGYPDGGFQSFIDRLAEADREKGVSILTGAAALSVQKKEEGYEIKTIDKKGETFIQKADLIISTLPYPISNSVMANILGKKYIEEQNKRKYLYAINLILTTKKPILQNTYWLNISAKDIPIMCIVQHTNFINSENYGGDEVCYVAWYVEEGSQLLAMNEKEILAFALPHLRNISPLFKEAPEVVGLFKAPYAQPIFDSEFITIPRLFSTPAKNVYVANMDMTYPFDRGTNYAVQLGKNISSFINKTL